MCGTGGCNPDVVILFMGDLIAQAHRVGSGEKPDFNNLGNEMKKALPAGFALWSASPVKVY